MQNNSKYHALFKQINNSPVSSFPPQIEAETLLCSTSDRAEPMAAITREELGSLLIGAPEGHWGSWGSPRLLRVTETVSEGKNRPNHWLTDWLKHLSCCCFIYWFCSLAPPSGSVWRWLNSSILGLCVINICFLSRCCFSGRLQIS